jgi:hypothetical protein
MVQLNGVSLRLFAIQRGSAVSRAIATRVADQQHKVNQDAITVGHSQLGQELIQPKIPASVPLRLGIIQGKIKLRHYHFQIRPAGLNIG